VIKNERRKKKKRLENIHYDFGARAMEVDDPMLYLIVESTYYLPDSIISYIMHNITFRTGNIFTLRDYILKGGIISLNDNLAESKDIVEAIKTVLHKIAHAYLRHKMVFQWDQIEGYERQEKEADELVEKWLINKKVGFDSE